MLPSSNRTSDEELRLSIPSTARFFESAIHDKSTFEILETPTLIHSKSLKKTNGLEIKAAYDDIVEEKTTGSIEPQGFFNISKSN